MVENVKYILTRVREKEKEYFKSVELDEHRMEVRTWTSRKEDAMIFSSRLTANRAAKLYGGTVKRLTYTKSERDDGNGTDTSGQAETGKSAAGRANDKH